MRRVTALPELLAPAGDMDALIAALCAGADAVYIGGELYGARAYAKNFTREEIKYAVGVCHASGVRLFVTVNTLIYDRELSAALEFCEFLYSVGVDAVIVCDLGLISLLRRNLPKLELHASTQLGIHNTSGADFAYALGMPRVVVARECSLRDIKEICESSFAECEIFVHGALCVCHSGQCLFSSLVGGRSGNRGECAQPCRLPYNGGEYPLSLKDLSLASHIPEIIESGVSSLKIEGRMKSASYVFGVVSIYRRLLDEKRAATRDELRRLAEIFSRDGFTDGYFTERLSSMTGVRSDKDKQNSKDAKTPDYAIQRPSVAMRATLELGKPSLLECSLTVRSRLLGVSGELSVTVSGAAPDAARTAPLTEDSVIARLKKLGGTCYEAGSVLASVGEGINLPPSAVNELRRLGIQALDESLLRPLSDILGVNAPSVNKAELPSVSGLDLGGSFTVATVYREEAYFELLEMSPSALRRFDTVFLPMSACHRATASDKGSLGVIFPPVIMPREWESVASELRKIRERGITRALVSNIGHLALAQQLGFSVLGDMGLNVTNGESLEILRATGLCDVTLSPELTLPQARDIESLTVVFGRVPLMITERCAAKECGGCEECGRLSLVDRYGERFPILREREHRSRIFNSRPTYVLDRQDELDALGINKRSFLITVESAGEIIDILSCERLGALPDFPIRRIGKRKAYGK